jgi:tripartite-type tricarboxylate transporter receptor subunit TctC
MLARFAAFLTLGIFVGMVNAQSYPNRPIKLVVTFPPGGGTDVVARTVAPYMSEVLGQNIVVENRPGAGGNVGTEYVQKQPADGYTMVLAASFMSISQGLLPNLPWNVLRDFDPIALVVMNQSLLVVHPSVPVSNIPEFIALAKAKPGGITIASSGNGSSAHLGAELFKMLAGVNLLHVPYKGAAPALNDVIGGHANAMLVDIAVAMPHAKAGRVKVLGIGSPKRFEGLPEVQTIAEQGVPGFEVSGIIGLMFPAGSPKEAIARVNDAVNKSLQGPQVQERLKGLATIPMGGPPERLAEAFRVDIEKWGRVIKAGNIKAD